MADCTASKELTLPANYQSKVDTIAYRRFLTKMCKKGADYAVFSFPSSGDDLLSYISTISDKNDFGFYWEKPSDSFAIAAGGTLLHLSDQGPERFKNTYAKIQAIKHKTMHFNTSEVAQAGPHFLGGFSFFDEVNDKNWEKFGASSFILPQRMMLKKRGKSVISITISLSGLHTPGDIHEKLLQQLTSIKKNEQPNNSSAVSFTNGTPRQSPYSKKQYENWIDLVKQAKHRISENGLQKVVLARQLKLKKPASLSPVHMVQSLRSRYPKCSVFLFRVQNSATFVGCSPEQLLSFEGDRLRTEALAGSIARGVHTDEDSDYAKELLNSKKNNLEHNFVVQSIESDLQPFVHNLHRQKKPAIKKLANVQHLYTPVRAQIQEGTDPLTILGRLHPTPAVGGYPRDKAQEYIKINEPLNRGWFASPIGWINANGSGEFTVAIRSGLIDKTSALLFAGCGIVTDSNPETEWQETNLKFMPMLSALNYD